MLKRYFNFFVLIVLLLGTSCVHKTTPSCHQRRCYYDSLCNVVYSSKSIKAYEEANYYYWTNQDVVTEEEATLLAKFMADSAHCVQAWNFYAVSSMFDGTDSLTVLYNLLKQYALGYDSSIADIEERLPLKSDLVSSLQELPFHLFIHPDSISNHRLMYYFSRMYGKLISCRRDTISYEAYRHLVQEKELFPIAKSMADSTLYVPAYLDVYRCYVHIDGEPVMMSPEKFEEAYNYLDYGVEHNYLPAIWYKSLLLLTGTYLPTDTIEGKRLLDLCLTTPSCNVPFWRK